MLAAIGNGKTSQLKHFNKRKNYDRFHEIITQARLCPHREFCPILQEKIYKWLLDKKEEKAAQWLHDYWMGEFGGWMLGFGNDPPFAITDNSNEAWFRWLKMILKALTSGTVIKTSSFVSKTFERISAQSKQQVHELAVAGYRGSLPSLGKLDKPLWTDVQSISVERIRWER